MRKIKNATIRFAYLNNDKKPHKDEQQHSILYLGLYSYKSNREE